MFYKAAKAQGLEPILLSGLRHYIQDHDRGAFAVGAPKDTPVEIIQRLNIAINSGLGDPNVKARLIDLGGAVLAGSSADFGKLIADETEKWGKVVKQSLRNPLK